MAARRSLPSNLKLENYSDREILHLIDDLADNDGYTRAKPGAANLMRREWAYGTHKNRRRS